MTVYYTITSDVPTFAVVGPTAPKCNTVGPITYEGNSYTAATSCFFNLNAGDVATLSVRDLASGPNIGFNIWYTLPPSLLGSTSSGK